MTTTEQGNDLETYVASQLYEKCLDKNPRREFGSGRGTHEKSDIFTSLMILGQNAGIECKHTPRLNLQKAWNQTRKLESLGREPVLVFKHPEESFGNTKCVIYFDTLLELVKAVRIGAGTMVEGAKTPQVERELAYQTKSAINALKGLQKALEQAI